MSTDREVRLRPARPADAGRLREVERAAGAAFAAVGLPEIAEAPPMPADRLAGYAVAGRSWVATDVADDAVGYVVVDVVDGSAHVEQLTVHPDHQGLGIGRRLLDEVERWAGDQGLAALTLTTFTEVPWNAPLYAHLGFVALDDGALGPGLRAVHDEEAAHGLDPSRRVCMRREVGPPAERP